MLPSLAVVMPVFNESVGIIQFVNELDSNLKGFDTTFIVVDDFSTDNTVELLSELANSGGPRLRVVRNPINLGHGKTTLRALKLGVEAYPDFILAVDGDGQIYGADARRLVEKVVDGRFEICEGIRNGRDEGAYRKVISLVTRVLVWCRSKSRPQDANTPFRAYRFKTLSVILESNDVYGSVPNLRISEFCRRSMMLIGEVGVEWRPRLGVGGTVWGKERQLLPNKKLILFCIQAGREWFLGKKNPTS